MNKAYRKCLLLSTLISLSGCTTYSGIVNSFAPAKQKSDVVYTADNVSMVPCADQTEATGKSPFCVRDVSEVYMVMPEADGKAGTVVVTFNDGKEVTLHGDYSAMSLAGSQSNAYVADQVQMEELFGPAVAHLPDAPLYASLYFLLGKDELTAESKLEAKQIYDGIVARQSPEVIVTGHTDTIGSETSNQKLSDKRAEVVKQNLISLGVPADTIEAYGLGEQELFLITADNVNEPKNRRVDINVR